MPKMQVNKIGDPSTNKQSFMDVKLKILCCRYWLLNVWDCNDLAFPFWRIYWNKNYGGVIELNETTYHLVPNRIYIIPPFTSFSTRFNKNSYYKEGIHVDGRSITTNDDDFELAKKSLLHLFIHFNLGVPFDNVYPGIFTINMTDYLLEKFNYLIKSLKKENTNFYVTYTLQLQALVVQVLSNIGPELFKTLRQDERTLTAIRFIENNITKKLTNKIIATEVNMATNSFSRLFHEEMNTTLHKFLVKRKISHACKLLLNTNKSIEEVAYILAFSDRHHFSRVFKKVIGITPSLYKSGKFT